LFTDPADITPFEVEVAGWNTAPDPAEFVNHISDHCSLRAEVL
jgi:hypothetical protein